MSLYTWGLGACQVVYTNNVIYGECLSVFTWALGHAVCVGSLEVLATKQLKSVTWVFRAYVIEPQ